MFYPITCSLTDYANLSGVYSGGLWGLEHPQAPCRSQTTNLAISSVLVVHTSSC